MTHNYAYVPTLMKTAVSLYLKSQNCYSTMREYLNLPNPNTINNYFGDIDLPGELRECENIVKPVFS